MKTILIGLFLAVSPLIMAQKKNTVYLNATPLATNIYTYKGSIDGGGGYDGKTSFCINVEYGRTLSKQIECTFGIGYYYNKMEYDGAYFPDEETFHGSFNLNYLSFPIQIKYKFWNYLFINGGGILNFRLSKVDSNYYSYDENLLGVILGIGGEFDLKNNLRLNVNPYFQMNSLDPNCDMNFYNVGIKLGVGYQF